MTDEPTRRDIASQTKALLREWYRTVWEENEGAARLLIRTWGILPGSDEERAAMDAWREQVDEKNRKPPGQRSLGSS